MSQYIDQKCHACDGKGFTESKDLVRCSCWQLERCYKCGGTGITLGVYRNDCLLCSGKGKIQKLNKNYNNSQPARQKNNSDSKLAGFLVVIFLIVGLAQWLWKSMENYASLASPYNYVAGWYNFFLREPLVHFYHLLSYVFRTSWNNNFTSFSWLNTILALIMIGTFIVGLFHGVSLFISFLSRKIKKEILKIAAQYLLLIIYVLPIVLLILILIFGVVNTARAESVFPDKNATLIYHGLKIHHMDCIG